MLCLGMRGMMLRFKFVDRISFFLGFRLMVNWFVDFLKFCSFRLFKYCLGTQFRFL